MMLEGGVLLSSLCVIKRGNNRSDSVHSEKEEFDYRDGSITVSVVGECKRVRMHTVRRSFLLLWESALHANCRRFRWIAL